MVDIIDLKSIEHCVRMDLNLIIATTYKDKFIV